MALVNKQGGQGVLDLRGKTLFQGVVSTATLAY